VIIEDDRIVRAGVGIDVPAGATLSDAAGRTVMPGMIDCHVHLLFQPATLQDRLLTPPSLQLIQGARNALETLNAGVTTVRDAGGTPHGFRLAIERGLIPGPRMKIAVSMLSQSGGHGDATMPSGVRTRAPRGPEFPENVCDGPDEVRKATRAMLRAGADFIKLCSTGGVLSPTDEPGHTQFTPEEIAVAVEEARAAGKTCMSHAQATQGIKNAVRAGVESIEHGVFLDDEAIAEMKARGTFLVPTLVAPVWVIRNAERNPGSILPQSLRKSKEVMEDHKASFKRAAAAGIRVAMGTDSGVGPHGHNAEELALMVAGGLTPMQAIVATTRTASECVHMADQIGTIEPDKLADLLIVEGDPLADITVLQDRDRLKLIMLGGRVHKDAL
jgi:imidazolonepropionase-like amidohydrolase